MALRDAGGFLRKRARREQPCGRGQRTSRPISTSELQRTPKEAKQRVSIESPPVYTPAPIAPGRVRGVHSLRRGSSDTSSPREKSRPGPPPGLGGVRGSHCGAAWYRHGIACTLHARSMHMPFTCHSHAMHMPCICHAHAMPTPCTCHAHAMPTPCTCHAHAMHTPCTHLLPPGRIEHAGRQGLLHAAPRVNAAASTTRQRRGERVEVGRVRHRVVVEHEGVVELRPG
eukprot:scaffold73168_cov66-Phaeocystis_antarctica.AAC.4